MSLSLFIKICGLREAAHVQAAVESGADLLGFVFAPSKRRVTPEQANNLINTLRNTQYAIRNTPNTQHATRNTQTVGLFVNEDPATMAAIVRECGLDLVQLCGDEAPDAALLGTLRCPVIRVVRAQAGEEAGISDTIAAWQAAAREADQQAGPVAGPWGSRLLIGLDSAQGAAYGGTGHTGDWDLAARVAADTPLMLAGGLTPANVAAAISAVRPWAVDVSSGVETAGVKDPALIATFVSKARGQTTEF